MSQMGLTSCDGVTFHISPHDVQILEFLGKMWIQSDSKCQISEWAEGHQRDLWGKKVLLTPGGTHTFNKKEVSHLVLVFRHQSDHCIDCMLFLDLLLPLWIFVLYHIPKPITSKVVIGGISGSNQRTSRTSKHWNLQGNMSQSVQFINGLAAKCKLIITWALLAQWFNYYMDG